MTKKLINVALLFQLICNSALAMQSLQQSCAQQVLSDIKRGQKNFRLKNCKFIGIEEKEPHGKRQLKKIPQTVYAALKECALEDYMNDIDPLFYAVAQGDIPAMLSMFSLRDMTKPADFFIRKKFKTLRTVLESQNKYAVEQISNPLVLTRNNASLCYQAVKHNQAKALNFLLDIMKMNPNNKEKIEDLVNIPEMNLKLGIHHGQLTSQEIINKFPVHVATENNNPNILKILLENEANPNVPDIKRLSPLHHAVEQTSISSIKLLLKYGANPDGNASFAGLSKTPCVDQEILSQTIKSPLDLAIEKKLENVTTLLIKHGAHITTNLNYGSLLQACASNGFTLAGKTVIENRTIDTPLLTKAILATIANKQVAFAKMLLTYKTIPALDDCNLQYILEHGFGILFRRNKEKLDKQELDIAKLIVNRITNKNALFYKFKNNPELLETILQCGLDPNTGNHSKCPLSEALINKNITTLQLLLKYGANPNIHTGITIKPWVYIFRKAAPLEIAKLIFSKMPINSRYKMKAPLHFAAEYGRTDIIDFLLARGADSQLADRNGNSALQLALKNYKIAATLKLIPSHIKNNRIRYYCLGASTAALTSFFAYKNLMLY